MSKMIAGIIGAGGISNYHIQGYLKAGVDVRAVVDPDRKRAESQAQKYNIPEVFSELKTMLEKIPEITLASICTPNKFHAETALRLLASGKNVFCEKPPALSLKETLKMKEAARKSGRVLMFDFNNRARPEARAMMQYIKNGDVGRINSAQAVWVRRAGIPGFGSWFTRKSLSGGGPLIDLLHMLDLTLYFMGFPEPEWVLAQTFRDFNDDRAFKGPWGIPDVKGGAMDVETSAQAFIRFKSGQVVFCRNSWAEMNRREEVSVTFQGTRAGGLLRRLFGRDGIDETAIDDCELYTVENGRQVNRKVIVEPDEKMGRETAVVNFVNTVSGREKPLSTPSEAVILMGIIEAVYQSAEKGGPVRMKKT